MIANLRGTLLEKAEGFAVVEAGGVGYMVQVSSATFAALPAAGAEVRLHTRHIVREDAQLLFGFEDRDELRLFDLLIGVNGVGPRIAIAVLSGLAPARFARAVRDENIAALTAVSGVGRKTAERLVVELRDQLAWVAATDSSAGEATGAAPRGRKSRVLPKSQHYDDAAAALVTLGYSSGQATDALLRVSEEVGEATAEDLVKRSLALLARPSLVTR